MGSRRSPAHESDISTGSRFEIGKCGRYRVEPLPLVGVRRTGETRGSPWLRRGLWERLAPESKKSPHIFHTLSPHATLPPPSVPNGWPGLTEPGPAGGGEFRRAGTVPAGRKLAKRHPGQRGGLPDRGGSGRGFSRANGRNRLRQVQRPRLSCERQTGGAIFDRRRLIRIPVRAGCPAAERGVTANAGLTSPCRA